LGAPQADPLTKLNIMRKIAVGLSTCLLICLFNSVSAQIRTKFGDNVSTLDGIIKAYYGVVTVKKGEKVLYERDSLIHWPDALIGFAGRGKTGKPTMQYISLKEFHRQSDASLEKDGFYESEISRKVENFGSIYHVWSTYEARHAADGPVTSRGINSIQLFFDGTRFWIMGWIFDEERKDSPLPAKDLTK
jgi:hypothetical protein